MKNLNAFAVLLISTIFIAGCSNPTSSPEYKTLKSEVDAIQSEIETLQSKVDSVNTLTKKLEELKQERTVLMDSFSTLLSLPSRRAAVINKIALPACKTYTYAFFESRARFDDIDSAGFISELKTTLGARDYAWSSLRNTSDSYPAGVNDYITALDFGKCYKTNSSKWFIEECESFDRLLLKKDTESFKGKCLKGTVKIAQADSATGVCAFQGYIGGDYDVRAQFGTTLDASTHATSEQCSDGAKKLTEGKFVEFYGFVIGPYTYTTTSNGSQTIPAFKIIAAR